LVAGVPQYGVAGGPDFVSEIANVAELGFRARPTPTTSYSATVFYSRYDRLRTVEPNAGGPGIVFRNLAEGSTRGIEMWGSWQAMPGWLLSAGWVAQDVRTSLLPGSRDASGATGLATSDPSNHWIVRSVFDLAPRQELDLTIRHTGKLERPQVPAYTTMDVRYAWKPHPGLELSVIGHNLFDPRHAEWGAAPTRSEYERALRLQAVWRM
jgi:iron complex outermembrane receptor protein